MATNHVFPSARLEQPGATVPKAGFVLAATALLLALVLGLSAVDIQRDRALNAGVGQATTQDGHILDGRGKWGGYL